MSFERHLLVDGANILHAWPELRARLGQAQDAARAQLVQRLAAIHDGESVRVTVVFDGRGRELAVERPSGQPTFSIVHTPVQLTADDVIEQLVAKAENPAACVVATDDRAEIETVSAAGASVVRSADLAAWLQRAEARQGGKLAVLRAANNQAWRRHE